MNIAVFVSGNGSNLQAIIDAASRKNIKAKIAVVVSDNREAYALERARKAAVDTFVLDPKGFASREDYDKEVIKELERRDVGLIVLAGFMRLVSDSFVRKYKNKIMNIHPSILPSFKGTHGIKDAFEYGVKRTGVTVHFVDEKLDHGPIILQESVSVDENDTLEKLEEKIHKLEHKLYPEAIRLFTEGKIRIDGRKVRIQV
ncbi:MAG: phosphoribosylglycinamide formyltransferase [Omnitrophica bacterium RBG_13_46_9]|nr:MAG: phosphoribosylglycinamide formyltransferase [Omnitrophica bacterium RBG_13_46_9]